MKIILDTDSKRIEILNADSNEIKELAKKYPDYYFGSEIPEPVMVHSQWEAQPGVEFYTTSNE